jgi:hypothetical protein
VYDLIEAIFDKFRRHMPASAEPFRQAINAFFAEEGIGWQLVNDEIVTRGTEAFETSVHSAMEVLNSAQRPTAKGEIH